MHSVLADIIVAVHFAYVAFVVAGLVLTLIGATLGWRWIRNPWFRYLHLLAIGIVAGEALTNVDCPLTVWEYQLRQAAGESPTGESFIGRMLHNILFYDLEPWMFTTAYVTFVVLVALTLWWVPPRRKGPSVAMGGL